MHDAAVDRSPAAPRPLSTRVSRASARETCYPQLLTEPIEVVRIKVPQARAQQLQRSGSGSRGRINITWAAQPDNRTEISTDLTLQCDAPAETLDSMLKDDPAPDSPLRPVTQKARRICEHLYDRLRQTRAGKQHSQCYQHDDQGIFHDGLAFFLPVKLGQFDLEPCNHFPSSFSLVPILVTCDAHVEFRAKGKALNR